MNAPQPEHPTPPSPAASGQELAGGSDVGAAIGDVRRWLGTVRVTQRTLGQCFGARSCAWLSRAVALGFVTAAVFATRPLPDALDAISRFALVTLSWCAGLAALSAAGPAPRRALEAGRGLLAARAIPIERVLARQPFGVALWIWRHVGFMALIVMMVCAGLTPEPHRAAGLLGIALGGSVYVLALGAGLGVLSYFCQIVGRSRGQLLLVGLIVLPELLSPAWPALPTLASNYRLLLDACLGERLVQ